MWSWFLKALRAAKARLFRLRSAPARVTRNENGKWVLTDPGAVDQFGNLLVRYLNDLDPLFEQARTRCEVEFVCSLLRVRGVQDAGWDPYETTLQAVPAVLQANHETTSELAPYHLQLWTYLHIMEASEPYELLANLLGVAAGRRFLVANFRRTTPPGAKIKRLQEL